MTLSRTITTHAPSCCGECEFSFRIRAQDPTGTVCCVVNNTHHVASQSLCQWYIRSPTSDLKEEMRRSVNTWMQAIDIRALPDHTNLEAIVNILQGRIGPELAKPKGDADEK